MTLKQYITCMSNDHMTLLHSTKTAQLLHHIQVKIYVQSVNVSTGSGTVYRLCIRSEQNVLFISWT